MDWLAIIGLLVWVFFLQGRVGRAENDLRDLRLRAARDDAHALTEDGIKGEISSPAPPLAQTPAVSPSRDNPTTTPEPESIPVAVPIPVSGPALIPPPSPNRGPQFARDRAQRPQTLRPESQTTPLNLSTWLSENGLAWLGGGALALGGMFLVVYAAQQGFFTPALRIWAAIALGGVMLGAGEGIRRQAQKAGGGHDLAAAMATGAGAATLYAAVWAAYALYHFIPLASAGAALAFVSLGLLALAFLHGEALAGLAVLAAFLVPPVCGYAVWPRGPLDGYLGLIAATGIAAAAARGWARVGAFTLACAGLWVAARATVGDGPGSATLVTVTPALAMVAAWVRARRGPADAAVGALAKLPLIALIGASVLWVCIAPGIWQDAAAEGPVVGALLVVLCALSVRFVGAPAMIMAAPAVAVTMLAAARLVLGDRAPGSEAVSQSFLITVGALAGASLALVLADRRRIDAAVIGAAATALVLTLLRAPLSQILTPGWSVFVGVATLLAVGAALIARRSADRRADMALAAWVAAAAEAVGLALHTAFPGLPEPVAYGVLAVALASLAWRLDWRGLAESSAIAGLASFAALLGPAVTAAALLGHAQASTVAVVGLAATAAQAAAWFVIKTRRGETVSTDALSTLALISLLLTAFLVLRLWGTPHGASAAALDAFTEAALRTVLVLVAGLVLTLRGGATAFARARGPVFLTLGAAHGLLVGGAVLNPWFGSATIFRSAPVFGPPLIDAITLAYLAPTVLLATLAWRQAKSRPVIAGAAALAGGAFAVFWAITEIRRLFHNPVLTNGGLDYAEAIAYAVAALVFALGLGRLVAARAGVQAAHGAAVALGWAALVVSGLLIIDVASPWWGPIGTALDQPALFFALMIAAVGLTAVLARRAGPSPDTRALAEAALAVGVVEAFVLLTLIIRFAFHGVAMRTPLVEASAETWTFSAAWALFGVAVLIAGARTRHQTLRWLGLAALLGTTLKVFLFDMARLNGVIRAGSFIVLGALLIVAALAARRLGGGAETPSD